MSGNNLQIVKKQFQCVLCTKSYTTASSLRVHVDAIHRLIRHKCPNCVSTFSDQPGLLRHLRLLCNRKPYQCERCWKRFPCSEWLEEHEAWHIHTDVDRYVRFYRVYTFPCLYCFFYFDTVREVFAHIRSTHVEPSSTATIVVKQEVKRESNDDDNDSIVPE